MGRYNNRRTQQAAQELRNTPSRARFSKGPPNKRKGRGGGRSGGRGGRGSNPKASDSRRAAVIDKISNRVEQKSQANKGPLLSTSTKRKRRHPLDGVDINKLDEITLSRESIESVTKLLQDLNIMEAATGLPPPPQPQSKNDSDDVYEEDVGNESPVEDDPFSREGLQGAFGGYTEYEDDVDETGRGTHETFMPVVKSVPEEEAIDETREYEESISNEPQATMDDDNEEDVMLRKSSLFLHLTTKLSFSENQAKRACLGIKNWEALVPQHDQSGDQTSESDRLALAMDWLCLHLTDDELKRGFRPNPKSTESAKRTTPSGNGGLLLVGTGRTRPIPHESISVVTPLTSDSEWKNTIQREGRKVGFLRLGFHNSEADKACDRTPFRKDIKNAEDDHDAVRVMLAMLQVEMGDAPSSAAENATQADFDFAASEMEQEVQALRAIYDDQFQVERREQESRGYEKYTLRVQPTEELHRPADSNDCNLHVFVRPGYPVFATPLLMFTNPTLPPSLLRRVNIEMIRQANQNAGEAIVFTIVDFLCNNITEMQLAFMEEQRKKEVEAKLIQSQQDAVDNEEEDSIDDNDGKKLGRRQRAKLRSAEKAYDRPEQLRKQEEERVRMQAERAERIKREDKMHRLTMAEEAMGKREKQRIAEEAERAARAAMNAAFNRGETAEEARRAAAKARKKSLRYNGEEVSEDESDNGNGTENNTSPRAEDDAVDDTPGGAQEADNDDDDHDDVIGESVVEVSSNTKNTEATPTTMAFMERLRQFYTDAANAKKKQEQAEQNVAGRNKSGPSEAQKDTTAALTLAKPKLKESKDAMGKVVGQKHLPNPIPIPTGDLAAVMKDVIALQSDQPWLVSPEARVPSHDDEKGEQLTSDQIRQRNQTSKSLYEDLKRKWKNAQEWGEKNGDTVNTSKILPRAGQFHKMQMQRQRLPASKMKDEIVNAIRDNQICVISADTGAGKTTQVPQLVLDDMIWRGKGAEANMIVTQPRRISAIGVAERVAAERCEKVGETSGYSIRLENKRSSKTRILLCTTGILLRRLQCDPDLASVSHVFVDEVHERDLNTDFLLIILKDLLARRKGLKLVLMSATLNAEAFSNYFGGCLVVSIPGRAHPVKEFRLEDVLQVTGYEVQPDSDYAVKLAENQTPRFSKSAMRRMYYPKYSSSVISSLAIVDETVINYELLADLLECITLTNEEGAILVFMPGMMEITKAIEEMYKKEFFQSSKVIILPLHSSLSTTEQTAVFEVPPEGVRKIVVSTNIAETSITIEDVVYVVDTGRVKENRKDEVNEMPTLVETWVARASAKQRRGRAGRVRPGIAYHMFSSHTFEQDMQEYQLPEMLRVGLEDLVLQILLLDLGEPTSFLAKAVNPPSALAMKNSLKLLEGLGAVEVDWSGDEPSREARTISSAETLATGESCAAVTADSNLTALGYHLATLPVDPRVGKMMIYGALFGCTEPALTIAASMSARSPFVSPFDKRDMADEARKTFASHGSDHLTTLTAFNQWKEMRRTKGDRATQAFLRESFLSRLTLFQMEDLRKQFANLLQEIGFLPRSFRLYGKRGGGSGNGVSQAASSANANADNLALLRAILCAGLYPNIIVAPRSLVRPDGSSNDKEAGECAFQSTKGEVYLHPCTISFSEKRLESRYCCFHEIVKTSKIYVRDCTAVNAFALLLFGGSLKVYHTHGVAAVDEWLKFRISAKPATLVKHLRTQMESMLLKKIVTPEKDVTGSSEGKALIQAVSTLLQRENERTRLPDGAEIVRPWKGTSDQQRSATGRGWGRGRGRGRSSGGRGRGGRSRGGRGSRGGRNS